MDINTNSSKQISSAINSKEAKNTAEKSNEYLADHIMNIINDPNYMSSKNPLDLQNVGYKSNSDNGYIHSKGNESFQLRIENKNFGIKQIRYWKHGNKMIYLVPLSDGDEDLSFSNFANAPEKLHQVDLSFINFSTVDFGRHV